MLIPSLFYLDIICVDLVCKTQIHHYLLFYSAALTISTSLWQASFFCDKRQFVAPNAPAYFPPSPAYFPPSPAYSHPSRHIHISTCLLPVNAMKRYFSLFLTLCLLLCSCGPSSEDLVKSPSRRLNSDTSFREYTDMLFRENVSCDALSLNYTLSHP